MYLGVSTLDDTHSKGTARDNGFDHAIKDIARHTTIHARVSDDACRKDPRVAAAYNAVTNGRVPTSASLDREAKDAMRSKVC